MQNDNQPEKPRSENPGANDSRANDAPSGPPDTEPLHHGESASPHHSHQEEPSFRDFLISFRTMDLRLRVLTAIVLAELIAGVILIAAKADLLPKITLNMGSLETVDLPQISYYFTGILVVGGLYLLTRGTVEATVKGRLLFIGLILAFYSVAILATFWERGWLYLDWIVLTVFYCTMATALPRAYRKRYSPERQSKLFIWGLVFVVVAPGLIFLFAAPVVFPLYLMLLRLPLVCLFFLAGTDWAEILDAISGSVLKPVFKPALAGQAGHAGAGLAAAGIILSCGIAVWLSIQSHWAAWRYVPPLLTAVVFVALVLRLAGLDETWHAHFSWAGLAVLVAMFSFWMDGAARSRVSSRLLLSLWPTTFSLLAAVLLVVFARRGKFRSLWPVLIYGMIVGMWWAVAISSRQLPEWASIRGPMLGIAIASLLAIVFFLRLRNKGIDIRMPVLYTILLNVGCVGLYALAVGVYAAARSAGEQKELIEATVVFIAIVWDILVSGHAITNVDGKLFPRTSRVYLFFGYVLLVVATIIFWSSLESESLQFRRIAKFMSDTELFVQLGIALYGPATLLTLFAMRIGGWLPTRSEIAVDQTSPASPT